MLMLMLTTQNGGFADILPMKPFGLRAFRESSDVIFSVTTLKLDSQSFSPSAMPKSSFWTLVASLSSCLIFS